jgi:hypothetical protein
MSRMPRSLTTRVGRLEATIKPSASPVRYIVVFPEDGESLEDAMQREGHTPADSCRVLRVLYGSARPESLV